VGYEKESSVHCYRELQMTYVSDVEAAFDLLLGMVWRSSARMQMGWRCVFLATRMPLPWWRRFSCLSVQGWLLQRI